MTEIYTKAKFWKCALQVNPWDYIANRGANHGMTEEQYNLELQRIAKENDIKVIGLANHGNVDGMDSICTIMNENGILVFPGFEIASTEKAHFVCLFPEDTSKDQLNRYLGALGLTNPANGVWPSNLGGNNLLANPKASCLTKMTRPSFESFKLAFQDIESRVRLNSDVSEKYYSRMESLKVTGGYLDGLEIEFSEHLNAVIGGRGTGKSTLLECIRHCLQLKPIGKNAQKQHDEIIKENLGKSKARVEIVIRSSRMNGRRFTVARRHAESASVKDESGNLSTFTPAELLPEIEIYGQNEIYEIAQDTTSQRQLLTRFLEAGKHESEKRIHETLGKLVENRKKLIGAQENVASIEDEVARLPKLEEQVGQFKTLGLEEKLKIVPLLEVEKRLQKRAIEEEGPNLDNVFQAIRDNLPDTVFLSDSAIGHLPHAETLRKFRATLDALRGDAEALLNQWQEKYAATKAIIASIYEELNIGIQQEEAALEKTFKELPSLEGKSGKEIGFEFQSQRRKFRC